MRSRYTDYLQWSGQVIERRPLRPSCWWLARNFSVLNKRLLYRFRSYNPSARMRRKTPNASKSGTQAVSVDVREHQVRTDDAIVLSLVNYQEAKRPALMLSRTNAIERGNAQSVHGLGVALRASRYASPILDRFVHQTPQPEHLLRRAERRCCCLLEEAPKLRPHFP